VRIPLKIREITIARTTPHIWKKGINARKRAILKKGVAV